MVLQQHAAGAMDEQPGVCKGVSVYALQAKATARVEVPETPQTTRTRGGARQHEFERKRTAKFPGLPAHSPGSSSRHVLH